jgi:hypothetical protein
MSAVLPNFFLAGAPKAGTTSLGGYLAQHPDIFMSAVKEPCFFASEVRPENFDDPAFQRPTPGLITEWSAYEELFRDAGSATAIGEASVCYLWSPSAPGNIAAAIPHARILLVLRDPAERAFSQYVQGVAKGHIHWGLREHIDASLVEHDGLFRVTYPFLQMGDYASQIRRHMEHFPTSQLHITLYEDFQRAPAEFLRGIFAFLGVDSDFAPDLSRRDHVYPERESLALSAADRRYLFDYYQDGILDLQAMLGRDLSGWLE